MITRFIEDEEAWIAFLEMQLDKELDEPTDDYNLKRIDELMMLLKKAWKGKYDPDPETKKRNLYEVLQLLRKERINT